MHKDNPHSCGEAKWDRVAMRAHCHAKRRTMQRDRL